MGVNFLLLYDPVYRPSAKSNQISEIDFRNLFFHHISSLFTSFCMPHDKLQLVLIYTITFIGQKSTCKVNRSLFTSVVLWLACAPRVR